MLLAVVAFVRLKGNGAIEMEPGWSKDSRRPGNPGGSRLDGWENRRGDHNARKEGRSTPHPPSRLLQSSMKRSVPGERSAEYNSTPGKVRYVTTV